MNDLLKSALDNAGVNHRSMPATMRAVKYTARHRDSLTIHTIIAASPHESGLFERWEAMQSAWLSDDFRAWKKACASYLLGTENAKTTKGEKLAILTAIMYLSPDEESGFKLCPKASPECSLLCLKHAGRLRFDTAQCARLCKTWGMIMHTEFFFRWFEEELRRVQRMADRLGYRLFVRPNGLSDWPFWRKAPGMFADNPDTQFYDYTKVPENAEAFLAGKLPKNYHLTFSRSELNEAYCLELLARGMNVAVVFANELPKYWRCFPVVNGDETDARPDDNTGSIGTVIGLKAKGVLKTRDSEFKVS